MCFAVVSITFFSNTFLQNPATTLLCNSCLQNSSPTTIFSNISAQHSSPTFLYNTALKHSFLTPLYSTLPQHFSTSSLQRSSPGLLYTTLLQHVSTTSLYKTCRPHPCPTPLYNTSLQNSSPFPNASLQHSSPTTSLPRLLISLQNFSGHETSAKSARSNSSDPKHKKTQDYGDPTSQHQARNAPLQCTEMHGAILACNSQLRQPKCAFTKHGPCHSFLALHSATGPRNAAPVTKSGARCNGKAWTKAPLPEHARTVKSRIGVFEARTCHTKSPQNAVPATKPTCHNTSKKRGKNWHIYHIWTSCKSRCGTHVAPE